MELVMENQLSLVMIKSKYGNKDNQSNDFKF